MNLKLSLSLESLSGNVPRTFLPGEPILFALALENTGTETVEAVSLAKSNGVCTGTVRDSQGKTLGTGSFLRFLSVGSRLQPQAPAPDQLERIKLASGECDEVRDNFLHLLTGPLPPGEYSIEVQYDAPQLKLRTPAVSLRIIEPCITDLQIALPFARDTLEITMIAEEDGYTLRHESRSAEHRRFIIHHGTLAAFPEPVFAVAETGTSPRPPGDPIWIGWVGKEEFGLVKSWSGVLQGDPIRLPLGEVTGARLGGPVFQTGDQLLVPLIAQAGNSAVLDIVQLGNADGAMTRRHRVALTEQTAVVSQWFRSDAEHGGVVVVTHDPNGHASFEAIEFELLSGELTNRKTLARVAGRVIALGAGASDMNVAVSAVLEGTGKDAGRHFALCVQAAPGDSPTLNHYELEFDPPWTGSIRAAHTSVLAPQSMVFVVASDNGNLYAGNQRSRLTRVAAEVPWPKRGLCLGPAVRTPHGTVFSYIRNDAGLVFRTIP